MKENCQNILKKKKRRYWKNHRQCKDSPAFFLSECKLHLPGHLIFWERSPVLWSSQAIAFLLIFYEVHGETHSAFRLEVLSHEIQERKQEKKKKRKKRNDPLCELKRNLDLGTGGTFRHVCTPFFPIRNGLLDLSFFCCYLGWVPWVKGWGRLHLVFFFVYFLI